MPTRSARSHAIPSSLCDALGGRCQIAPSESQATERAVLLCTSDESWTLQIEALEGQPLVALPLTGDREERLRKAAMWIARIEDESPIAAPPVASAPADEARFGEPFADDPEPLRPKPKLSHAGGLSLDASIGVTSSSHIDSFRGLRASLAFAAGPFHVGPVATYEQDFATEGGFGNARAMASIGRVGARAGWGAPFGDRIVGFWLETPHARVQASDASYRVSVGATGTRIERRTGSVEVETLAAGGPRQTVRDGTPLVIDAPGGHRAADPAIVGSAAGPARSAPRSDVEARWKNALAQLEEGDRGGAEISFRCAGERSRDRARRARAAARRSRRVARVRRSAAPRGDDGDGR